MPYNANGDWVATQSFDTGVSDFDRGSADIPIWGWLSGATGRVQRAQQAQAEQGNRGYFDSLHTPSYSELDSTQGRDAESRALAQFQQYSPGTLTGADRAQLEASRQRDAQGQRASQQALMQQAQARGVGGSGLDYTTRQQSAQQSQTQASDAESQALAMAQQRGLLASQSEAELGSRMRSEEIQGPRQAAYEDQIARARGATGQYGTDASSRNSAADRDQRNTSGLLGLLGGILS